MIHYAHEAANLAIVLGYLFLAVYLAPRLEVRYKRTRIGGVLFFALCATTHLGLLARSHWDLDFGGDTPWWVTVHVVQAGAVWLFIDGLYRDYIDQRTAHQLWKQEKERRGDVPGEQRDTG